MPWKEICALEIRKEMIADWLTKEYTITEISNSYDVSRKTIYKWIGRYHQNGMAGLVDLSKEPDYHPNATSIEKVAAMLELKRHLKWHLFAMDYLWPSEQIMVRLLLLGD